MVSIGFQDRRNLVQVTTVAMLFNNKSWYGWMVWSQKPSSDLDSPEAALRSLLKGGTPYDLETTNETLALHRFELVSVPQDIRCPELCDSILSADVSARCNYSLDACSRPAISPILASSRKLRIGSKLVSNFCSLWLHSWLTDWDLQVFDVYLLQKTKKTFVEVQLLRRHRKLRYIAGSLQESQSFLCTADVDHLFLSSPANQPPFPIRTRLVWMASFYPAEWISRPNDGGPLEAFFFDAQGQLLMGDHLFKHSHQTGVMEWGRIHPEASQRN